MPLVPEPFEHLSVGTRPLFLGIEPLAPKWGRFCPNLDIPQYREPLSTEKKTELDKRAAKLSKRAIVNQLYKSSEFGWEVCAWHDVFGLVMDDQALRMSVTLGSQVVWYLYLLALDTHANTCPNLGIRGRTNM